MSVKIPCLQGYIHGYISLYPSISQYVCWLNQHSYLSLTSEPDLQPPHHRCVPPEGVSHPKVTGGQQRAQLPLINHEYW